MTREEFIEMIKPQTRDWYHGEVPDVVSFKEHPVVKGVWCFQVRDEYGGPFNYDYVLIAHPAAGPDFQGVTGPGAGPDFLTKPRVIKQDEKGVYIDWPQASDPDPEPGDWIDEPDDQKTVFRPYSVRGFVDAEAHKAKERDWKVGDKVWVVAFNEGGWGSVTVVSEDQKHFEQFYA